MATRNGDSGAATASSNSSSLSSNSGTFPLLLTCPDLNLANLLFIDEKYGEAIATYARAIEAYPLEASIRLCRAAALIKVGEFEQALKDCEVALGAERDQSRPPPPLAVFRKGQALFWLGRYAEAREMFVQGEICDKLVESKYIPWARWIRKVDVELSHSISSLSAASDTQREVDRSTSTDKPPPEKPASSVRHDWSQSEDRVFITFYCKGLQSENCQVEFTEWSCRVTLQIPNAEKSGPETDGARVLIYEYDKFVYPILPDKSNVLVTPMKVEVRLHKATSGHWLSLTDADLPSLVETSSRSADRRPMYPSSSKQQRDWSKVDKECEEELKQDAKAEVGDAALNNLFKEIYSKGNEETRKAMIKSFQTSGGTVLSTNWNEVKDKDYEKDMTAPEGQEVRRWEN